MSDFKWFAILVFVSSALVLVEPFDEPVSDLDPNGRVERIVAKALKPKKTKCESLHTINELNVIIIEKAMSVVQLIALEKKMRNAVRRKIKSTKSSRIKNQIFVQFFGRNQTSVEIDRQPFKTENEKVPQTASGIDIGKLNWMDASFDRNLNAIDFTKITAEELKRILDEVVKHSNCPLGSFYDARKGCISLDTFGLVPEAPKVIDIEALFTKPLPAPKDVKETRGVDFDMKTREMILSLLKQLNTFHKQNEATHGGKREEAVTKIEEVTSGIDEGEIPIVFQSLDKNILRPIATIVSPEIVAVKQENLDIPSGTKEMKIERVVPNGIELEVGNVMKNVLQNMSVENSVGNAVVVEPRIIKESFPMKMLIKNSGKGAQKLKPLKLSLEAGEGSMTIKSPGIKSLNSELENVLASLASEGKSSDGKIALQHGNLFKNDEDKSSEMEDSETETTTRFRKFRKNQAFVVAELPLVKADREFSDDQTPTTAEPPTTNSTTRTFRIVPALVDTGKEMLKAKKKLWSSVFPGLFDEHSNKIKENASYIDKNVPKPSISFESVEGKTLSDSESDDAVTEGMKIAQAADLDMKAATEKSSASSLTLSPFLSIEATTKSMNKN